jgi:hypothetical protein
MAVESVPNYWVESLTTAQRLKRTTDNFSQDKPKTCFMQNFHLKAYP